MSKEIVCIFIKRFEDAITNDKSKFPLKDMFVKIKDDLPKISLKDQEDIVRENVLDLEDLLSECQAMSNKLQAMSNKGGLKGMKCYSPSEKFYIIKTSFQLKKIRSRLQGLQKADFDIQPEPGLPVMQSEYQWTYGSVDTSKIYGWDERVNEINKTLLKENNVGLNMVGIVGNIGTGKTALAQKIFMSDAIMDAFCLRLWVCVSPDCGPKELVWRMLDNLGVEDIESRLAENLDKDEVGVLLFMLYVQLMEKRYLIVFDDVCECEEKDKDWQINLDKNPPEEGEWKGRLAYGLPKESGSAIIVTSRFQQVAEKIVGRKKIYSPDRMDEENAWSLFKTSYVEVRQEFDDKLESMKTEITKKCDGVPLALHIAAKKLAQQKKEELNAEPKEENTGESEQLEDGKAESGPANNNTKSVGANKNTTQDDTTNKEGINDTNKTAA